MELNAPEELKSIKRLARDFVRKEILPLENQIEEKGEIPEPIINKLKEMGFFGITIPEAYGGMGIGILGFCLIAEEFGWANGCFRSILAVSNGIGSKALLLAGTEQQRQRYLPDIAAGRKRTAFALTEPGAGSDAAALETTAIRDGDCYILNGTKHFITNAPIADLFTVLAVTDKKLRAKGGITAFLIEKGTPGLSIGQIHRTMGAIGALQSEVIFDDCKVLTENVVGQVGEGFAIAMKTLDEGRVSLSAFCVGAAERLLIMAKDYAQQRVQFGKPIAQNQAIQWMLADMATEIYATRMMVYHTARKIEAGEKTTQEAAMTKLFATEMVGRAADKALQVHGGMGYMKELPIERFYRDVRYLRFVEGTSEIQRIIISREILKRKEVI